MSAVCYTLDIACKGDPAEARAMWLLVSRPRENAEEREFSFDELSPAAAADESFSSSSVIDANVFFNSVRKEKAHGNPEKFYPLLAKAFPDLKFFIVQERRAGNSIFLSSFEAKHGRMRATGKWESTNPLLSAERRAWLGALQGHWLCDGEPPRETFEAAPLEETPAPAAPKQTAAERLAAVQENPEALAGMTKQTPRICRAAVENSGRALRYVKKQSAKICLTAVKQDGLALEFVGEQTREICRAALAQNYLAYRFVRETSPSLFQQFSEAFQEKLSAIKAEEEQAENANADYQTAT